MDPINATRETITDNAKLIKQYGQLEYEHFQLRMFYQVSKHTSSAAKKLIYTIFFVLFLAFAAFATSFYLGELMNSIALGFLTVSGFFLACCVIVFLVRRKIEAYVVSKVAQNFESL